MVDPGKIRRNTHKRSFDYDVSDSYQWLLMKICKKVYNYNDI